MVFSLVENYLKGDIRIVSILCWKHFMNGLLYIRGNVNNCIGFLTEIYISLKNENIVNEN